MWVPLHIHSQYSILEATPDVEALAARAAADGMPALALTDHGNLFGAIEFYKACQEAGIKPILGCEYDVAPESRLEKKKIPGMPSGFSLILLAKNLEGYHNLCELSSKGYLEGFYYTPRIDHEILRQHANGLICLSGGMRSRIAHEILNGTAESVDSFVSWFKELFGENFYFELRRHLMSEQQLQAEGFYTESWRLHKYQEFIAQQNKVNETLLLLSQRHGIRCVATNDTHYLDRSDWHAHEILINIQSGEPCEIWELDSLGMPKVRVPNPKRVVYPSHQNDFKTQAQMAALFADVPEALENTVAIASQCDVKIDFKSRHYPIYLPPDLQGKEHTKEEQAQSVEKYLWHLCEKGIPERYNAERLAKIAEKYPERDPLEVVRERLNYEMSVIVPKGMADYLLIVWDFIYWAKSNGIPVGPGRGSGAGSIVLYLIGVTDIDPLHFNLFFERFINPERISYPDIDVDICMDKRGDVIAYTLQKYGKDNVAQIITFGTMKARMAIKDVGRVLNVPLTKVNAIAKLLPEEMNITISKALEMDPELRAMSEQDEEAHRILDIAQKLEGSVRNTGLHAAGIIISGDPLTKHIPLCISKDSSMPVTQFSMKPVEAVGMLKIDFLGLKTLTSIKICADAIHHNHGRQIDWVNLPLDDAPTFQLLNQGKTLGIFQLESGGMQDLSRQLHLDRFEEIIAVGALYRPGPMDMIPSFINRKHGREVIENDHPWMQEILAETYGIMVYQEQVMQIASRLANYTLGEGDVLRKAMGKKDAEQMAQQREKFRLGALSNGIDEQTSSQIFNKIEKFAAYGFNKSHATAYGYLSYVTAYFKSNYPKEWMAALMTCDRDDISKIAKFISECQNMGIAILPPDVNEAGEYFVATPQGIRFAMTGIKGVGSGVVQTIIHERAKGPFQNFYDFFKRIDCKKVGKKVVENLVDAGSFDFTGWSRDELRMSIDPMFESASKEQRDAASGVLSLFAKLGDTEAARYAKPPKVRHVGSKREQLMKEKALLGFFLTEHPLDEFRPLLQRLSCIELGRVTEMPHDTVFRTACLIESVQVRMSSKTQKKFAIIVISDGVERFELPIWSEMFDEKATLLQENQLIYAVLQVDRNQEELRLSCRWFDDLTRTDDAMIAACDRAYDMVKQQLNRPGGNKGYRNKSSAKKENTPPMKTTHVKIQIDADKIRMSHLMQVKEIFNKHRGSAAVTLTFMASGSEIAAVRIEQRWGVLPSQSLSHDLKAIDAAITHYEETSS